MNDDAKFADFFARMAEVTRSLGRISTSDDSGALAILDDALMAGSLARVEIAVGADGPVGCVFSMAAADGSIAHLLSIDASATDGGFRFLRQ